MDRLAAALLGPLRREWRSACAIIATGNQAAIRAACVHLTRHAWSALQAVADLLHAALEARRPGSTMQAGIDAAEWFERLQDQIDALRSPQALSADDTLQRCERLGAEFGAHLQRQMLLASELPSEQRPALARKLWLRRRRGRRHRGAGPASPPPKPEAARGNGSLLACEVIAEG